MGKQNTIEMDGQDFYFVPFGRHPGGLLDFLGLVPDAPAAQVESALGEYYTRIQNEMLAERKQHRRRKKEGEISSEEFDRIVDQLNQQADRRTAELLCFLESFNGAGLF